MSIIQIKGVSKNYGNTRALDDITLTLESNKIYGLLGRNGAGKTTLLNIITNKVFPTDGQVLMDGVPVYENDTALSRIYHMTEADLHPEGLQVKEIFDWTKAFYPKFDTQYALALAEKFGLDVKKKIKGLSTGYNSIFKAIVALASNAEIIMFDEPVLGLDANHREMLYKEILANYNDDPKCIVISTHLIEEVAEVLEEVIIIKEGKIISNRSVEDILSSAYTISGESSKVDAYIANKEHIEAQIMGRFKSVTVLESIKNIDYKLAEQLDVQVDKVELQKLFISLTSS